MQCSQAGAQDLNPCNLLMDDENTTLKLLPGELVAPLRHSVSRTASFTLIESKACRFDRLDEPSGLKNRELEITVSSANSARDARTFAAALERNYSVVLFPCRSSKRLPQPRMRVCRAVRDDSDEHSFKRSRARKRGGVVRQVFGSIARSGVVLPICRFGTGAALEGHRRRAVFA
jgi:hypothetical protein